MSPFCKFLKELLKKLELDYLTRFLSIIIGAHKAQREELETVLYLLEKVLLFLPEHLGRKWQYHAMGRLMSKLLHPGKVTRKLSFVWSLGSKGLSIEEYLDFRIKSFKYLKSFLPNFHIIYSTFRFEQLNSWGQKDNFLLPFHSNWHFSVSLMIWIKGYQKVSFWPQWLYVIVKVCLFLLKMQSSRQIWMFKEIIFS